MKNARRFETKVIENIEDKETRVAAELWMAKYKARELDPTTMGFMDDLINGDRESYNSTSIAMSERDLDSILSGIVPDATLEGTKLYRELLFGRGVSDIACKMLKDKRIKMDIVPEQLVQEAIGTIYSRLTESKNLEKFEEEVDNAIEKEIVGLSHVRDDGTERYLIDFSYDVPVRVHSNIYVEAFSKDEAIDIANRVLNNTDYGNAGERVADFVDNMSQEDNVEITMGYIESIGERNNYSIQLQGHNDVLNMCVDRKEDKVAYTIETEGLFSIDWDRIEGDE